MLYSINHALADETYSNIIKPLVKSAYENGISCVSNKLLKQKIIS
ncbi:hypothetical protein [Clostridium neonatale]